MRNSLWDPEDLTRRLCHALDIAHQTVERLGRSGYTDPENAGHNLRPEKIISETALLLYATSTVSHLEQVRERTWLLAEQLLPYARGERMALGICLEPALAWDYALAHVLLKKLGYHDAAFDAVLSEAVRSQAHSGRERTPYRVLEQQWLRQIWANSSSGRKRESARASALGRSIDLLNGSKDDIYAFTHAVMYVTDFNISPGRLPKPKQMVHADAEASLAFCLDEQDYDLGGEVILVWPLTGKSWSPAAAFCFRVLAHVEDQAGFLPSPGTRLDRLNKMQGDELTDYLLATAYHTVYVMGLLCATTLQAGRTPPRKISGRGRNPGSAKMILQFLDQSEPSKHWRETFNQLDDREQDAIAELLLSIALRQKVKQRDFDGLHGLLVTAYQCGLADNPVASQAAELLERITVYGAVAARFSGCLKDRLCWPSSPLR